MNIDGSGNDDDHESDKHQEACFGSVLRRKTGRTEGAVGTNDHYVGDKEKNKVDEPVASLETDESFEVGRVGGPCPALQLFE